MTQTHWLKWECAAGNRWLTPADSMMHSEEDGGDCIRCKEDHTIKLKGETSNRKEATDWIFKVKRGRL